MISQQNKKLPLPSIHSLGDVVTVNSTGLPLCYVYSDVWDFSYERTVVITKSAKLVFHSIPEQYRRNIQTTLKLIYDKKPTLSISSLSTHIVMLQHISDGLCSTDWTRFDHDEYYRKFKLFLKNKAFSFNYINMLVTTINILHDLGLTTRLIKSRIAFSRKHCAPEKQTPKQAIAIPEGMARKLFETAIGIVDRYHPYRSNISQGYADFFEASAALKKQHKQWSGKCS
ncbi:MAG: hypothetical protein HRT38_08095 [Alteromonadaceae bacterium]|nr:hypothetical protein [Alteromonadaceae bacterium]